MLLAVVTASVEVPEVATDVGVKLPVAPLGKPLALRVTVPVNPLIALTVTEYVVLWPAVTVCELGEAEIEKSGGAFTTRETVVLCVRLPLVPVMVSV